MQTNQASQEEFLKNIVDSFILTMQNLYHINLSRGPSAVEWIAKEIPRLSHHNDSIKESNAVSMGALLGESIIATYGGKWKIIGQDLEVHLPSGVIVHPVEVIKTQMRGGQSVHAAFLSLGKKKWWKF